ncbi:hypothetical protein [Hansschlegelia zhihuaiae]|nr:hypothetical protein [Hansschlegelia zhihuaiae]
MTKSLDAILDKVSRLPAVRQDEIARLLEKLVDFGDGDGSRLSASDWAEVDRRLSADVRYASDEDVAAFFREALS